MFDIESYLNEDTFDSDPYSDYLENYDYGYLNTNSYQSGKYNIDNYYVEALDTTSDYIEINKMLDKDLRSGLSSLNAAIKTGDKNRIKRESSNCKNIINRIKKMIADSDSTAVPDGIDSAFGWFLKDVILHFPSLLMVTSGGLIMLMAPFNAIAQVIGGIIFTSSAFAFYIMSLADLMNFCVKIGKDFKSGRLDASSFNIVKSSVLAKLDRLEASFDRMMREV